MEAFLSGSPASLETIIDRFYKRNRRNVKMAVQVYGTSKFAMFHKRIQRNLISEGGSFNSLNSIRFISELGSFPASQFVPWERDSCRTFVSAGDEMSIRNLRQPIVEIMKFAMF